MRGHRITLAVPTLGDVAILIDLQKVSASRPGRPLFDSLSIALSGGDRLGVVGLNGSGKSTLLRIMAGLLQPESGVVRRGRGVRIGFLSQRPTLASGTVRAAVGESWEAAAILDLLKMTPLTEAPVETLSGGQAKRVALAQVLMAENDLLILDEPTNHLDLGAIVWLEATTGRLSRWPRGRQPRPPRPRPRHHPHARDRPWERLSPRGRLCLVPGGPQRARGSGGGGRGRPAQPGSPGAGMAAAGRPGEDPEASGPDRRRPGHRRRSARRRGPPHRAGPRRVRDPAPR